MENEIRKLLKQSLMSFRYATGDKIDFYIEVILTKNFTIEQIRQGMLDVSLKFDSLPSVMETVATISGDTCNTRDEKKNEQWDEFLERSKKQKLKVAAIKKENISIIGKENLDKYITAWYTRIYGRNLIGNLNSYGLDKGSFEAPPLLDLRRAKGNAKLAIIYGHLWNNRYEKSKQSGKLVSNEASSRWWPSIIKEAADIMANA